VSPGRDSRGGIWRQCYASGRVSVTNRRSSGVVRVIDFDYNHLRFDGHGIRPQLFVYLLIALRQQPVPTTESRQCGNLVYSPVLQFVGPSPIRGSWQGFVVEGRVSYRKGAWSLRCRTEMPNSNYCETNCALFKFSQVVDSNHNFSHFSTEHMMKGFSQCRGG